MSSPQAGPVEAGQANWSARWALAAALALALLAILIRLPYLNEPFDTDEGGYAVIARAWLGGAVPYRDAWDNKPPLTFLIYAIALAIADRPASIRVAAALSVALATLLLIGLGRSAGGSRTGLAAGAIFVVATALPRLQGTNANTEIFLLPGWIGAAWAVLVGSRTPSRRPWLVAGAAIGQSALAKPVAGWLLGAVLIWLAGLAYRRRLTLRQVGARLGLIGTGLAIALVPVALYFAAQGALSDAFEATILFNRLYLARNFTFALDRYGPLAMAFVPNRAVTGEDPGLWLFGLAGLVSLPILGRNRQTAWLLLWAGAGYLGAKTGWLELAHYYLQVVPALALGAALYLVRIGPILARRHRRLTPLIGLAGGVALLWSAWQAAPILLVGRPDRFHELKFAFPDRGKWDVQAPAIGAEIARRTEPTDLIFIWGREPQIYYYAHRRAASRYIHDRPVWIQPGVLAAIRADLAANRPALVLDTLDPVYFPEANRSIQDVLPPGYEPAGSIGFARVYARRP